MNLKDSKSKKILVTLLLILTFIVFITAFVFTQVGPYNSKNNKDIVVEIPAGSTLNQIADILNENKLIKNELIFKMYVRLGKNTANIKSGKYLLNQTYSNKEIINDLIKGKVYNEGTKITIPEGSTSKEIIKLLVKNNLGNEEKYLELVNNPKEFYEDFDFLKEEKIISLEGFLYPSTYYFKEDETEKEILSDMIFTFKSKYSEKLQNRQKEEGLSLFEVVNLASIVEKEAVLDEDRPIIASVFYNRMKIGMPLQSDATIQYAFEKRKKSITYADLKIDSPYNSYKKQGLPPTPIANPGIKSIEAVLYPEDTQYLYFVARIDGGNTYSKTYEEHLKAVEQYRKDREERNNSLSKDQSE